VIPGKGPEDTAPAHEERENGLRGISIRFRKTKLSGNGPGRGHGAMYYQLGSVPAGNRAALPSRLIKASGAEAGEVTIGVHNPFLRRGRHSAQMLCNTEGLGRRARGPHRLDQTQGKIAPEAAARQRAICIMQQLRMIKAMPSAEGE